MKVFIKFSAVITLAVSVLACILMLACPSITPTEGNSISGAKAIFGYSESFVEFKGAPIAIVAFVLVILAVIALLAKILLPLLKVNAITKYDHILSGVIGCVLVLAGILLFFTLSSWLSTNNIKGFLADAFSLGIGIIISAILYIIAGIVSVVPCVLHFVKANK